jgi:GNAT superfamily N-acetyltransferase
MRQDGLTAEREAAATIRPAASRADIALARKLFVEYAQWLQVDLCFQGFEQELANLPGAYAPPRGRLLLAGPQDDAFGCIALRPLDGGAGCGCSASAGAGEPFVGEVKRLYVQPAHRREGWGGRLIRAIIDEAHAIGYRELKLDTLERMSAARALYADVGFHECPPYYNNPLAGAVYMALSL